MRAWCISHSTLTLQTREKPTIGPNDVLINVKAIGVNRADILQTYGLYPAPKGTVQDIPGLEYSGVVSAVGDKVLHRKIGDKVMGLVPGGSYAEYIATHEDETLTMPSHLTMAEAATIPEAYLTAYRAIYIQGNLQHGQWCFIRPATSGVGLAAVQLCQAFGNPTVGSSRHLSRLHTAQSLGLTQAITEDETIASKLLQLTNNHGVSVILDMVGPHWNTLLPGLAIEGHLVIIGILGGNSTQIELMPFLQKRQHLSALTMRQQPMSERLRIAQYFETRLLSHFEKGSLTPLPYTHFSFSNAPNAHEHMQKDHFSGKRVILVD